MKRREANKLISLGCLAAAFGIVPKLSAANELQVVRWMNYDAAEKQYGYDRSVGGIGGFFERGMRWGDYISQFGQPKWEICLAQEIVCRDLMLGGFFHQNAQRGIPVFNDGKIGLYSMRAWGDLMAAVWSEWLNHDYCYVDFAWYTHEEYELKDDALKALWADWDRKLAEKI